MAKFGESDLLKCSFCGKSQKQVKKLIAGPGVYICDECIDLCNEIIEEEFSEGAEVGLLEDEWVVEHGQGLGGDVGAGALAHGRERDRVVEGEEQGCEEVAADVDVDAAAALPVERPAGRPAGCGPP
jgi:hypothetical protein